MTDTKQPMNKRILGDQRIFQAVFNDLKMKHELVELADGTHRWVYTYDGVDPYEMEDSAFPLTMQLIHQYGDTREAEGRISDSHDWDVETFEPITVCRRCATTFQTRGNKPCKGKMAKIGLRAKLKKTKEESNDS